MYSNETQSTITAFQDYMYNKLNDRHEELAVKRPKKRTVKVLFAMENGRPVLPPRSEWPNDRKGLEILYRSFINKHYRKSG